MVGFCSAGKIREFLAYFRGDFERAERTVREQGDFLGGLLVGTILGPRPTAEVLEGGTA